MAKKKENPNTICTNKRAVFDYFIKDHLEAGLVLEGWEVKSIRSKKVQLLDSYIIVKRNQAYLLGSLIQPLKNVANYLDAEAKRTRKLLLHHRQISQLKSHIEQKGQTLIASKLYWKNGKVKVDVAFAIGKKQYDKRESIKDKQWQRDRDRFIKNTQR